MPELPEVETIRRGLEPYLKGKTISGISIYNSTILLPEPETFESVLPGLNILALNRKGKYLIMELSDDWRLVIHLRMTGKLLWIEQASTPMPPHTHVVLNFPDQKQLRFNDVRRFGRWWLVPKASLSEISGLASLGPEPIQADFNAQLLNQQLAKRHKAKIKPVLLDQRVVAGLGNIYVDEALFLAGIHPLRTVESLSPQEIDALVSATRQVLNDSIQRRGTSFRDYLDGLAQKGENQNYLNVFQQEGNPCPNCGALIKREKIGGRSSFFCPNCQRLM